MDRYPEHHRLGMDDSAHDIVVAVTGLPSLDATHAPITKLPPLDIFDHGSYSSLPRATTTTRNFQLQNHNQTCGSDSPQSHSQAVIYHLQQYAHFIIGLTGQDTISILCNLMNDLRSWRGILVAERGHDYPDQCHLLVAGSGNSSATALTDVTDFSFHFGPLEEWDEWCSAHVFSIMMMATAECAVKLSGCSMPEAAVKCVLDQVEIVLSEREISTGDTSGERLSILTGDATGRQLTCGSSTTDRILLHELFEAQARQTPEHCAIEFIRPQRPRESLDRVLTLSYKELNEKCDSLAKEIRVILDSDHSRRSQNFIVPVFLSASPELYVSYLAILKAGCGFCPLPTDAPSHRLKDILEDVQPAVVLGIGTAPENDPWLEASCCFNFTWLDVRSCTRGSYAASTTQSTPSSLAYLMYTSGSTGKAKGVQMSHRAATASIAAHMERYQASMPRNIPMRWYQFAAPTFDPSIMEIFVTLCCGGTLCSAPREMTISNPEAAITETRSTVMMATPGFASILDTDRLPTLQCLWTMGETLGRNVIASFAESKTQYMTRAVSGTTRPTMHLCNAYGPTEAAINVTFFPNVPNNIRGSIIGYPLATSSILVIDPKSSVIKPVPLGFVGELVVMGRQVSLGYLRRPKENSVAFVEDDRYGRLYRTGDRARVVWDAKGTPLLEYLGRFSDEQVKINGQRVELGEIESVLCILPEVRDAVAVVERPVQNGKTGVSLVACLVLNPNLKSSLESVSETCKHTIASRLPSHMQPARFAFVNLLPRTSAGKVDRKEIVRIASKQHDSLQYSLGPHIETTSRDSERDQPDSNPREGHFRPSFERALQKTIGPSRSASEHLKYGLDSLSALRFLRNIKEQDIHVLSLKDILHASSIEDLARLANDRSQDQRSYNIHGGQYISPDLRNSLDKFRARWQFVVERNLDIAGDEVQDVLPTTATQTRLLLSFSKSCSSSAMQRKYVHHSIHNFPGEIDVKKLKALWSNALKRHDVYRTVFTAVDDDLSPFAQTILIPSGRLATIRWFERSVTTSTVNLDNVDIIIAAREAELMITLENPTPILTLVKSPGHSSVLLSMVHAIFDLGSLHLLLEEIAAELDGNRPLVRRELRFAAEAHFASQTAETNAFWNDYLYQYEALPFPSLTRFRSEVRIGSTSVSQLTSALSMEKFEKRSRDLLCSPLAALQAAWSTILLAYTSFTSSEVVFGSVFSDRSDGGKQICVAPTFSVIPTRTRFSRSSLNIDVLRTLTDGNSRASRHLQSSLRTKDSNRLPYDTTIALQVFQGVDDGKEMRQNMVTLPMAHDYAVMIEAIPDAKDQIFLKATYSDRHLDHESAKVMLSQLDEILIWILTNPVLPYCDAFNSLKPDKLSILNPRPVMEPAAECYLLHTQFELNARAHPDRTALEYYCSLEDTPEAIERYSYRELNAKANSLAEEISSKLGDTRGAVIPILIDKQPELYLAVLGALKAGAAWSPIDVNSPAGRRQGLITRLGAKLILTSQNTLFADTGIPEGVEILTVPIERSVNDKQDPEASSYDRVATPDCLAYLIWTSGTTGAPKGVPISHRAGCASMAALQARIPNGTKNGVPARCLQFSQHTFDVFVQDLFFTWGVAGTVISASREVMTNSFAELSRRAKASHAHLTPAFAATVGRDSCPSLEVVTMIGEKLPQHVADDWGRGLKGYNTYGPAEVTVVSTIAEFSGSGKSVKSSNIGGPLPSISSYVLREGKEVMIQGIGELALGGPQLAAGYLNDLEKTGAKFIKYDCPEKDLYLTGDIVRQLTDRTLDFIGREDDLVKLGGIRVELSEISFVMRGCHKLIAGIETRYISRRDRPSKVVVSFIAANVECDTTDRSLPVCTPESAEIARCAMKQAQQSLPDFMVPSTILILQKIPNTSSAKIDRKALEKAFEDLDLESWEVAMTLGQSETSDGREWSSNGLRLRRCLSEFSSAPLDTIHVHSSLHSLGIDSLSAGRFAQRLRDFDMCLNIMDILQSQTVHDVIRIFEEEISNTTILDSQNFATEQFNDAWLPHVLSSLGENPIFVMPTTTLQDGLLSESMLNKSSYWSNHLFELNPNVAIDRLHSAWKSVVENTEALRTCFINLAEVGRADLLPSCPSSFLQIVSNRTELDWDELDTSGDLSHIAQGRANRIVSHHNKTTFHQNPFAVTIIKDGRSMRLMLTIHHAIHDAESLDFIMNDLASAYQNLTIPRRSQIRDALPPSINYKGRESDEGYWQSILSPYADIELPPWPELIGVEKSPNKKVSRSMISGSLKLNLDREKIAHATRTLHTSFSVILKVAFGCLLLDYLETSAVVFAEVLSQRFKSPKCRDAIAPLVATIPVPFTAKQTAVELFSEQNHRTAQSWSHGSPSGAFVRKILRRSPKQPLYPAVFVFHPPKESTDRAITPGKELWHQGEDPVGLSVEHDLALNVYSDDGWTLEVTVSDRVMNHDSLKIFCRQVEAFTYAILSKPNQPLLGLLDHAGCDIISRSESSLPESETHPCNANPTYWLEHYSKNHPDWNAVEVATSVGHENTKTERWSYSTLFKESRKFARFIRKRGHNNEIIGVCTGRTLESYAIIVGILMSGNTYLPIDDGLPLQRKFLLLDDSKCPLLVTDKACVAAFKISPSQCSILNIDDSSVAHELQRTSDAGLPPPGRQETAYLLYTSGSTGKPKGVLISHRSLCGFIEGLTNFINQCCACANKKAGVGKWLGLASRAFDVHLAEMFLAWRSGLTAVTAPREILLNDLRLALTSLKVSHACFVPSLLEQAELTPDQIPDFVFMTIGGEKLSKRIVDTWAGHARITAVNAYGPTELAIGCSASQIVPNLNVSNIGFPYGNTTAHVLIPETFHHAKKGQSGELCFTGCLVGNGYLNRPDAKGFVEDFQGQRMYRTGDMARMLRDGSLLYLGRSDDQTKLRGQRMELSEISENIRTSSQDPIEVVSLLVNHPEFSSNFLTSFVADSIELAKRYDVRPTLIEQRIGGFTTRIIEDCKRSLPAYMVPDYLIPIDVIPLAGVSGKADTKTLKTFFASLPVPKLLGTMGGESSGTFSRQLTPSEQQIADIVKGVLSVGEQHDIKSTTNLFTLGLDSLNAVGLAIKLREIGVQCTLTLLLGSPTVESIAIHGDWGPVISHSQGLTHENKFRALRDRVLGQDDLRISEDAIKEILPCLPMQESTVALSIGTSKSYINNVTFKLERDIDIHRFKKAWQDLINDTPILRTIFYHYQDSFIQLILCPQTAPLPWTEIAPDLEDSAQDFLSDQVGGINQDISERIQDRPAVRLHFVKTSVGHHLLLLSLHHALYDGQSFDMMMEDLRLRYNNQSVPRRTAFKSLLQHISAQDVSSQKLFWNQYLAGSHPMRIGTNKAVEEDYSQSINQMLKIDLSQVRLLANNLGVTLATLTQSLFAIILSRRIGRADILFGSVLSGRSVPIPGTESIMAPCITTIPQRIQFQSNDNLSQLVRQVQSTSTKCLDYQHSSLRDIARWACIEQPMFETLFSFTYKATQQHDNQPWKQIKSSMFLGYPLAIEFTADDYLDALTVTCEYQKSFGTKKDAQIFAEDIETLLIMIMDGEDPKISSLGIVEQAFARGSDVILWDETNWSAVEQTIRKVLHDITGIEAFRITKNATFFQLGIDSVSAIRLAKHLRQNGLSVNSADIMRYPSTGALGNHLPNELKTPLQNADSTVPNNQARLSTLVKDKLQITADSIEATYYCTPLQAGMIIATLASDGDAYVHRHARTLPAEIDIERLRQAWTMTVRSSDILRTSFHHFKENEPQWIACVHREMTTGHLDCSEISQLSPTATPIKFSQEEDFSKSLFQAEISYTGEESIFRLTLHHALYDGISLPMVFERFALVYRLGSPDISQVPSYYKAAQLINKTNTQSTGFWLETLKGYRSEDGHERSNHTPRQMSFARKCRISPEDALEKCKVSGVTLQSALLTAYSKTLATVLGRRDIAFGHVVSGRSLPIEGCESIVGPLFNTVPIRIRIDRLLDTNQDMMKTVLDLTTRAQTHQHASLSQVQNAWRMREPCDGARLFDSLFLFQKVASGLDDGFARPIEEEEVPAPTSEYCLNVEVEQNEAEIVFSMSCHEGCSVDQSLDRCIDLYEDVLRDLLDSPMRAVGSYPQGLSALPLEIPKIESKGPPDNRDEPSDDSNFQIIKGVLANVSGISLDHIASTASIFALGLTSLSAINVAAECRRQGLEISVANVLQGVTAKGIYDRVAIKTEHKEQTREASTLIKFLDLPSSPVKEEYIELILPALSGQTYHLDGWLRSGRTMNMPTWSYTCSKLDIDRFQRVWALLRERHPILRTTFTALTSTKAAQLILKSSYTNQKSFSYVSGLVDTASVQQYIREQQKQATDMETPPVRLQIVQGPSHDVMLLTIHHALYDAWSLPIIISDLIKLYHGSELESPPDWQLFVQQSTTELQSLDGAGFWRKTLCPFQETIIDRRPPNVINLSTLKPAKQTFLSLPNLLTEIPSLSLNCRAHNISLPTLLLLSFARSLSTLTSTKNPLFGVFTLGRSSSFPFISQLAGPCLNVLPLVVHEPWKGPWVAKAREIQSGLAERTRFEQAALCDGIEWAKKDRKGDGEVEFNVYVNILWHDGRGGEVNEEAKDGEMFELMDVGVPSDFVPEHGLEGETGLEQLDWPVGGHGVYVDIALNKDGSAVDIGARIAGGIIDEEEAREWLRGVGEGVKEMLRGE